MAIMPKIIEEMAESITIVGAGIGGLTTALALKRRGINATVYESAPEIKPVGAGIIMANNAMQIFRELGIQHKIEQAGHKVSHMEIANAQLQPLSVMELTGFENKYGVYNVAIHRGDLQMILAQELGFENIKLDKSLSSIEKNEKFQLFFEDKTKADCDVLIGADGIKSTVRSQLFAQSKTRDAKQTCWRGICEIKLQEKYHHRAYETWGKGKRFGFVKINDKKTYWYAVANHHFMHEGKTDLVDLFKEFHPDLLDIILQTPKETIFLSDILDLAPIKKWYNGNACLLGDAAHATTPNLGQGACQAIEDAYALAQLVGQNPNWENIFIRYQQTRMRK